MNEPEQQLRIRNDELEKQLAKQTVELRNKDRELEIEASLERIRSRTMAMQGSIELREVVAVIYDQLQFLGFKYGACTIIIMDTESGNTQHWVGGFTEKIHPESYQVNYFDHPFYKDQLARWKNNEKFAVLELSGEMKKSYDENMFSSTDFSKFPEEAKKWMSKLESVIFSMAYIKFGALTWGPGVLSGEQANILQRFAKVFEQTYTRFLDLKKAEAQTREAQIEVALERVRAKALAMQTSNDLLGVANVLREQMRSLGQAELESSIVHIYNDASETFEAWYAFSPPNLSSGEIITGVAIIPKDSSVWAREVMEKYKSADTEYTIIASGQKLSEWYKVLEKVSPETIDYDDKNQIIVPEILYYHFSNFSGGSLLMISNKEPSAEARELQKRAAIVFGLAYIRFLDLQKAEAQALRAEQDLVEIKTARQRAENALNELQITQKQLVQTEKMASLGELTAGIAHEIQNPLNFVNNFSEVNRELVDEMQEALRKDDKEEAIIIATDIKENLEKINHHGKRADAIVKGMLQHSRSSTGRKELTDINALADEYLRLSYHGLRAKDKSFNATLQKNFDENIGNVNIVPQDIGRVLLNLFNNAFYAVTEKRKHKGEDYQPTISVSTKKTNTYIEVSIKDNGNGISQSIIDKIFQPFFTTKPTGKGTGLGLSLSYDIIKAHGGEIKVETNKAHPGGEAGDDEGAEFIIQLPIGF